VAATAGAAALLAGCGDDGGDSGERNSALYTPVDTTKNAKKGGILRASAGAVTGTDHFDPLRESSARPAGAGDWLYGRMLRITPGLLQEAPNDVEADLAQSWEVSPDGLQITFKMRPTAKWDRRAPTNSRPVDAEDVAWSWTKFSTLHNQRASLANSVNPGASVVSITAADKTTVIVKLAQRDSGILMDLAHQYYFVQPREAESQFDPRQETRGCGAWIAMDYDPSLGRKYAPNPNWYRTDRPFVEQYDEPIIPEYVARLAQFKAGRIYQMDVSQEDLLPTKRDVPQLLMTKAPDWSIQYWAWQFGWAKDTIFEDDRLRKAASMALDRDLLIRTFSNAEQFEAEGLETESRWNSHIPAAYSGWWIDPQTNELGPGARFFKYDPAEAKKLLAAAGHPNGLEVPATYSNFPTYALRQNESLVHLDMLNQIGFRTKLQVVDQGVVFQPRYQNAMGDFTGITTIAQTSDPAGARGSFFGIYMIPGAGRYHGFRAKGQQGDPEVTKMVNQIRGEFDEKKQAAIAKDMQKHLANQMYWLPWPGIWKQFQLFWPVLQNYNIYRPGGRGAQQSIYIHYWLDETKAPVNKPA
jgi:ABC-type transport system substrate-binding protein